MDIEEIEEEIEMIKMILEMHSTDKILRKNKDNAEYIDQVLDRLSELMILRDRFKKSY